MTKIEKVLYTAKEHTTVAGRAEPPRTDDGRPEVKLSSPGTPGIGTNPRAAFRRRLVSLFPQCDKACGRQKEGRSST